MRREIIGREREINILETALKSENAELIAVYGRRRVGKTFLIKEYFNNKFDFYATGLFEGKKRDELEAFCDGFDKDFLKKYGKIKSWMDAFSALKEYLISRRKKVVVFLDELPWFDVPPSRFLKAFEWFWNSWGSTQKNLKLIVCGSATTWMRNKFISSKGGLYNRTTRQIYLAPFKLKETFRLLKKNGIYWGEEAVLNTYMAMGGVPYYLNMLDKSLTPDQNIDALFFSENAPLKNEYSFLLKSLFKDADYYRAILDTISQKNKGVTRKEIIEGAKINDNGGLTRVLKTLIDCDFIREYPCYEKQSRDTLYQIIDPFVLFYKRWVENYKGRDEHFWSNKVQSPSRNAWKGIAFEIVSLIHLNEIKNSLGISGISTWTGSWYYRGNQSLPGAQIDMLIDRVDRIINVCEMKYYSSEFELTKKMEKELRTRNDIFLEVTKTRKTLLNVLVSPWGEKGNRRSGFFSKVVTLKDLIG